MKPLEDDKVLADALGEGLLTAYLAVKMEKWRCLKDLNMDDEVDLLLCKY
jgi:glutamine synthetase